MKKPETVVHKLAATGKWYINAVSTAYDSQLPIGLAGKLDARQFQLVIEDINDKVSIFWPCPLCRYFGMFCCPFTLGLSLLCPHVCFSEAENALLRRLNEANNNYFDKHGLEIVLVKNCFSSWLEIREPESHSIEIADANEETEHWSG